MGKILKTSIIGLCAAVVVIGMILIAIEVHKITLLKKNKHTHKHKRERASYQEQPQVPKKLIIILPKATRASYLKNSSSDSSKDATIDSSKDVSSDSSAQAEKNITFNEPENSASSNPAEKHENSIPLNKDVTEVEETKENENILVPKSNQPNSQEEQSELGKEVKEAVMIVEPLPKHQTAVAEQDTNK